MTRNQNANLDKVALLQALTGAQADALFSDQKLHEIIDAEFAKSIEHMNNDVLDACCLLLERRHSPFTDRQIAASKRRSRRQFKRSMRRSRPDRQPSFSFPIKFAATAAFAAALTLLPIFLYHHPFRISMPPDKQQYLVVGMQRNEPGAARAVMERDVEEKAVKLDRIDKLAQALGYQIELPTWMPEEYKLSEVNVYRNAQLDNVNLAYSDGTNPIFVDITYYASRDGVSASYEQDINGEIVVLENGSQIYLSSNIQSSWGLFQSAHVDYLIDATNLDGDTIVKIFNSLEVKDE